MRANVLLVALALLVGAAVAAPATECYHNTYVYDPYNNQTYVARFAQLGNIVPAAGDFEMEDDDDAGFTYVFRICQNAIDTCGQTEASTPVCQKQNLGNGEIQSRILGRLDTEAILDFPGTDKLRGVLVEYTEGAECQDGSLRSVGITLECNHDVPLLDIRYAGHHRDDTCAYEIYAFSKYACPEVDTHICTAAASCSQCAAIEGCGWCGASQLCLAGDMESPTGDLRCVGSRNWIFGPDHQCVDCNAINSKSECAAEPDCHFCVPTADGPFEGCRPLHDYCEVEITRCNTACNKGSYCPSEGGDCAKIPSAAGMFIGGMILSAGLIGIGYGIFAYVKKRRGANYEGLS